MQLPQAKDHTDEALHVDPGLTESVGVREIPEFHLSASIRMEMAENTVL